MQPILEAKIILIMMAVKIFLYLNQCSNILKGKASKLLHGNQQDCLLKKLVLLATLMVQSQRSYMDNAGIRVKFNRNLLKQDKVTYNHGPIVNIYIVY